MAGFLRGKQAGIQNDLSAGILPELFAPDDQARHGINSQIGCLAYDPVQSLLAIGTNESAFGSGQIYVFGQRRVQASFTLPRRASVKTLQFCSDRLISLDSKNEIIIWDLVHQNKVAAYAPPGIVTSLVTDPMLDWALIGLQNGEIIAYDLDREKLAPLRLPNFWRERSPRSRVLSIVSMQLHPRDIGQLLIGYNEGAVIYSFKQNKPIKYFDYEVPVGAPGGNPDPLSHNTVRKPQLVHVFWHSTGTFIGTAYTDESLVFWDPKDGRIVMARTLSDSHVNIPGHQTNSFGNTPGTFAIKEPFSRIAWCCKANPDDTGILIAGGMPTTVTENGLSFLELGPTPVYSTSTWQALSTHLEAKKTHLLPTPPGAEIVDFCLIPRTSPHFAGAQDPIAVIALLSSGELITLSFPSGYPISPTNQFHPSISFVHPFITSMSMTSVDRTRWLGMVENRQQGPQLVRGGAEGIKNLRRYESRNIIQMAHGDGTVRIWDAGHDDEIENSAMLQVDIAKALDRYGDVNITSTSMGSSTGELAVGVATGEVVIYRWGANKLFGRDAPNPTQTIPGGITDIVSRAESSLKEGLQPFVLYDMAKGPITAIKMSEVGFVAIGSEGGFLSIIDLRGPVVIFNSAMTEFMKSDKRSSFMKKGSSQTSSAPDWAVTIEFGVMTLEGDNYSSIACFVGTNLGKVITLKILPESNGGYTAQFAGFSALADKIISISPIVADTGRPALATGAAVAALRSGQQTHGTLVAVSQTEARIFKPATAKGAHKTFDDFLCDSANVVDFEGRGHALVGVFGDGKTRAYSLPGLKEISAAPIAMLDRTRTTNSIVTTSGDIFGWTGPSEIAMLSVWGTAQTLRKSNDKTFNPEALVPPRPTISNMQWIAGTQYVSPTDLDLLIGGPDRPPSKRMMAAAAAEDRARSSGGPGSSRGAPSTVSTEGWGDYMTRQLNERTEKLNIAENTTDRMLESSQGWADGVNKYVNKQKRNMVLGGITGKWF
ncbi:related to SRO77-polarized exocytosis by regulating SNARE function [Rhynchosporium secalis]|uniref:Related to SRO77-polarized exocytosis by regulating SNARE function n=1 Tax=Rhynchosporium secalis TaxID=38038 RepID=A0A1E1M061_RHYSE|nr:related to SRO77-polarized exocytosis by regulating SNARE function [Rhynchosporium secalis]